MQALEVRNGSLNSAVDAFIAQLKQPGTPGMVGSGSVHVKTERWE